MSASARGKRAGTANEVDPSSPGASLRPIEPEGWVAGRGYSNGMLGPPGGRTLFIAGQIAWDESQEVVEGGFARQFEQALRNVVAVVRAAGGDAGNLGRLTIFVIDKAEYLEHLEEVGKVYRSVMGKHYPAMSLVEVSGLLEAEARVEIEATAVLP